MVHKPYEKSNALEIYPGVAQQMNKYAEKHKEMFFSE